jgi:hypothetical protein
VAKSKPDSAEDLATDLSIPERILLFCVASATEWKRAGITGATVTVVLGLSLERVVEKLIENP